LPALGDLKDRSAHTAKDHLVFVSREGIHVDGSTLRRRYHSTLDAAGLRRPRFHDLRHTYGSLLAAAGVDLVTIKSAMDHSALAITGRHLHARPASEQA
jgi:integrase